MSLKLESFSKAESDQLLRELSKLIKKTDLSLQLAEDSSLVGKGPGLCCHGLGGRVGF